MSLHQPEPGETSQYQGPSALAAWNLMGGINGDLLPVVIELWGIEDVELFMRELAVIRDFQNRKEQ